MGYICKADFVVDYEYVDKYDKLTYKGFLRYLLDAGSKHSDIAGYGLKDVPKTGLVWLVLGWKLKIFDRPLSDSVIHVETWSAGSEKVCSYRDYKVYNDKNELIAIATSKWVLFNKNTNSITRITEEIVSAYSPIDEHVFDETIPKLAEPSGEVCNTYNYTIMRRDIDTNNHVHNTNYLDIALECLPQETYENMNYGMVEIMYKKQALLGDKTSSFYYHEDDGDYVVIKSEDLSKLHCIVKFS